MWISLRRANSGGPKTDDVSRFPVCCNLMMVLKNRDNFFGDQEILYEEFARYNIRIVLVSVYIISPANRPFDQ